MDRPCRTHSWKVSWQMLLLAASILSSCFLLTRGQETTGISIRVVPEVLKEGNRVILTPEGLNLKKLISCKWYRGAIEERNLIITSFLIPVFGQANGTAHTGRETGNKDCSLQITDLKPDDSGTYSFKPEALGVSNTGATNITVSGVCRRNGKTSTQVVSTPQIYENVPPPGQVHPENSSSAANTYETLQPRIPSVYEEIQR